MADVCVSKPEVFISQLRFKISPQNSVAWCNIICRFWANGWNRNRKYISNMADVCFLKMEVVISQPLIEICRRNLVCWQTLTFWRQWHQQVRNRNWYFVVVAAILKNGNDVIFLQWVLRFGRNLVVWCRMTCKLREVVEIKTTSRIPIWQTFVIWNRK